jgi:hypothetical protein
MNEYESSIDSWKNEQVKYFKGYLNNFKKDSKEYKMILDGISDLEKSE